MTNLLAAALLSALIAQESPNGQMVGDNGLAIGRLQITQAVVTDVNRWTGQHIKLNQMNNIATAQYVAYVWFKHYEPRLARGLHRNLTNHDRLILWNRGYKGARRYYGI